LQKQLIKYNKETFDRFMQNLTRELEERIKANNQLRYKINEGASIEDGKNPCFYEIIGIKLLSRN
jgi:hypothetical protein